jgi:hypothetical protein
MLSDVAVSGIVLALRVQCYCNYQINELRKSEEVSHFLYKNNFVSLNFMTQRAHEKSNLWATASAA